MIDPAPGRRWRRSGPAAIAAITRLEALSRGNPAELVIQALESHARPATPMQIGEATGLDQDTIGAALQDANGKAVSLGAGWWIGQGALTLLLDRLAHILAGFHRAEPLRSGIRPESLRRQLGLEPSELDALLTVAAERGVAERAHTGAIAQPGYVPQPTRAQRVAIDRLMDTFASEPYTPPSYKEAAALVGEDVLAALLEWGELLRVSPDVLLMPQVLREIAGETERILAAEGRITIKALRDRFNTSRKYAQAILEYFDNLGITRREGDDHVVGSGEWSRLR